MSRPDFESPDFDWEGHLNDEIIQKFPPVDENDELSRVLIVANLPKVELENTKLLGKLTNAFKKIINKNPNDKVSMPEPVDVYFPPNDEGTHTRGIACIEYESIKARDIAKRFLKGRKLGKKNIFDITAFEEYEKYLDVQEYEEPDEEYQPLGVLVDWLLNEHGTSQFALRYGVVTEVSWNLIPGISPITVEHQQPGWSEKYVQWSPKGNFLTCFRREGCALFGGKDWKKPLRKFKHEEITYITFSPKEKFLITFSQSQAQKETLQAPRAFILWNIITGQKLLTIPEMRKGPNSPHVGFKWSFNDRYFSRVLDGNIWIYEADNLSLYRGRPLKLNSPCSDHAWSPTHNFLAVFIPQHKGRGANVTVYKMPELMIIGQKTWANVESCELKWAPSGNFISAKLERMSNKKKKITSFEIFRIKDRSRGGTIPAETIILEDKVIDFAWEKKGDRLAIIHGIENDTRYDVSIYELFDELNHIITLEREQANRLFWSPNGRFLLMAGMENLGGVFHFYDAHDCETLRDEVQHSGVTHVAWDPTGRYVSTVVSSWYSKGAFDPGFKLWTFYGKHLFQLERSDFSQFDWRPFPDTILPKEEKERLDDRAFFGNFQAKYRREEKLKKEERANELQQIRENKAEEFNNYMLAMKEEYQSLPYYFESPVEIIEQEQFVEIIEEVEL
eukprot:TRINITY_DN43_c1_g1_i1.p1 TRINITY_DN43_c1_g1~~TRINITY_DN43_c1_g1_i1.p1  ORF type:complete len:675 (-),score=183.17 TRINITY_DN43_c1_g1_i1:37-2061(-)